MSQLIGSETSQLSFTGLQAFDPVQFVDTLIVSDIHLGSKVSRARELLQMLPSYRVSKHRRRFRRLVLLGDIFDDLNFTRLKRHAWDLVGLFRQITDEDSNAEVVWLRINERVASGIIEHARKRPHQIDAAFCGHTHIAESIEFKRERMWYYNTGCWTGKQAPTYAAIDHEGNVEIREYHASINQVSLAS